MKKNKLTYLLILVAFLFTSIQGMGSSIEEKKRLIQKIEEEIARNNSRIERNKEKIKDIDNKTETVKEKIVRLEKTLKKIEKEKDVLKGKIEIVNRKIDYGRRGLKFSSSELASVENDRIVLLQVWQKNDVGDPDDIENFKKILDANQDRQDEIKGVRKDISKSKREIEVEQRKLKKLERELARKEEEQEKTKKEQNRLIAQYSRTKDQTITQTKEAKKSITHLQREKRAIEKEIEKIIRNRTKQLHNVNYSSVAKHLGSLGSPLKGGRIVVRYNQRKAGNVRSSGQEIRGRLGDVVVAANKGKVIYAGKFLSMGKVVMIDHGYNLITIYGNLIGIHVKLNQRIKKGEDLGVLGLNSTGNSTLYYETRFNLKSVNPDNFN